jgi:hypothetical protein
LFARKRLPTVSPTQNRSHTHTLTPTHQQGQPCRAPFSLPPPRVSTPPHPHIMLCHHHRHRAAQQQPTTAVLFAHAHPRARNPHSRFREVARRPPPSKAHSHHAPAPNLSSRPFARSISLRESARFCAETLQRRESIRVFCPSQPFWICGSVPPHAWRKCVSSKKKIHTTASKPLLTHPLPRLLARLSVGAGFVVHKLASAMFSAPEPAKKEEHAHRQEAARTHAHTHTDVDEQHTRTHSSSTPKSVNSDRGNHDVDAEIGTLVSRVQHTLTHQDLTQAGFHSPPVSPGRPGRGASSGEPPAPSPHFFFASLASQAPPFSRSQLCFSRQLRLFPACLRGKIKLVGACDVVLACSGDLVVMCVSLSVRHPETTPRPPLHSRPHPATCTQQLIAHSLNDANTQAQSRLCLRRTSARRRHACPCRL